ncbi:DUF3800 domain-containing protein [Agrococcus casei]|uniref:DUF3800 domain-containing protein n=1 Tax=Agrococcus casei TaxID=343512 RepID=UPI003F903085
MFHTYLDESYTADFFSIGAVIADESTWDKIGEDLAAVLEFAARKYDVEPEAEFHGHEIMGGVKKWKALRGKHREAAHIYAMALDAIIGPDVSVVFRGLDIPRLHARYKYPNKPHAIVLQHILERIDAHCGWRGATDESVIVVCDEVGTQLEHQTEFMNAKLLGTPGYRSSRLKRISQPINFVSSDSVRGVQAADLVTYLLRRRAVIPEERNKDAERAMSRLSAKIDESLVHSHIWIP